MTTPDAEPGIEFSRSCGCSSDSARGAARSVVVVLSGGESDVGILKTVIAEEKRLGHSLPVDPLIALVLLRQLRRLDTVRLAKEIQRGEDAARRVLERLVEAGLIQAHGATRGRTYTVSAQVYQRLGDMAGYVRQAGFDSIRRNKWYCNTPPHTGESRGKKPWSYAT